MTYYAPLTAAEKRTRLDSLKMDYDMPNGEYIMRLDRDDFGLCPDCEGFGGTAWDRTGGMAVSCVRCDETGLIPKEEL